MREYDHIVLSADDVPLSTLHFPGVEGANSDGHDDVGLPLLLHSQSNIITINESPVLANNQLPFADLAHRSLQNASHASEKEVLDLLGPAVEHPRIPPQQKLTQPTQIALNQTDQLGPSFSSATHYLL